LSGGINDGVITVRKVEMIWDGSTENIYRRNGAGGTGIASCKIQWGWRIISETMQDIVTNLGNTSGGGGPTQIS